MKQVSCLLGCIGLFFLQTTAHAANISLTPSLVIANVGDTIQVDVIADFTGNPTRGGGLSFSYDPSKIQYDSFSFTTGQADTLGIEPMISDVWTTESGELDTIAFSASDFVGGIDSKGVVGTISFNAIAGGNTVLDIAASNSPFKGGSFISATSFTEQSIDFLDADISVGAVPLPAAAWLMLTGLGFLGFFKRRG